MDNGFPYPNVDHHGGYGDDELQAALWVSVERAAAGTTAAWSG